MADIADLHHLFVNDVPLMDVRAPIEFAKGAVPHTVNLPLMDDAERKQVGTCYKEHGQQAAIAMGHRLVSGEVKANRVAAWAAFARQHPQGALYCARGGLRSQIVQQWMAEAGVDYPRVQGGFKAIRTFLIETLQRAAQECEFVILGGLTGTGKTDLLLELPQGIDLEGHARHRGSSFGALPGGQPSQVDFENNLAIDLLKKRHAGHERLVLEDEGHHIGHCAIPQELRARMQTAPVVWLEEPFESRVERILRDYVVDLCRAYLRQWGPGAGWAAFATQMQLSLDNIRKRLGGERHQRLSALMQAALEAQRSGQGLARHRDWIAALLAEYYDPMYAYQRQIKHERIVFVGDRRAVLDYLRG